MKIKFSFLMFLLMLTGALSFSSCTKEDEELATPTANFTCTLFDVVEKGGPLDMESFSIDETKSSKGIHIDRVIYSLDGEEIATTTSSPFGFRYIVENQAVGEHDLAVYVECSGDGYVSTYRTFHFPIYIYDCLIDNDYIDGKATVSNGETFSGHIVSAESNNFTITKVEYFWDDVLLGTSTKTPFNFSYKLNNEKAGDHKFKSVVTTNSAFSGEIINEHTQTIVVK